MSWSFYATGKPAAVALKALGDLSRIKCHEPEEAIKGMALKTIEAALAAMPESSAVRIEASGSQSPAYDADHNLITGKFTNNFKLSIEPIYGFVE